MANIKEASQPLVLPEEKEDPNALPPQVSLFKGQIILNPTISKVNFFSYLVHSAFIGLIFIPLGLLQSPLFKNVYNLDQEQMNNLSSTTTALNVVMKFCLASSFGYICDKYGRKFLVCFGAFAVAASVFVLPDLPSLYPWYYLTQIVQELGFMSLSAAPLLADYVDYETKGRVAGLSGGLVYTTSFLVTLLGGGANLTENIPLKHHELGIMGAALGCILLVGLKGGNYHKKLWNDRKAMQAKKSLAKQCPDAFNQIVSEEDLVENYEEKTDDENGINNIKKEITRASTDGNHMNINPSVVSKEGEEDHQKALISMAAEKQEKNFKPGLMAGLREAKNPWVLTGYLCSFLMICDVGLLNYILVTYVSTELKSDANQAVALANKRLLVGIFTGLFFGFFADKYNKFKLVIFTILCATTGVILLIFTPTAYNFMAYSAMVLFGFSCSGLVTLSSQLQSKYANAKYRASVSAVASMGAVIGQLSINIVGVYLMNFNVRAPFYIFLSFTIFALIFLAFLYSSKKEILNRL